MLLFNSFITYFLAPLIGMLSFQTSPQSLLTKLKIPSEFSIHIYAEGVKDARQMALGKSGTLFVGSR